MIKVKYEWCLLNGAGTSFFIEHKNLTKMNITWNEKYEVEVETSNSKTQYQWRKENRDKEKEGKFSTENEEKRSYIRVHSKEPCKVYASAEGYQEEAPPKMQAKRQFGNMIVPVTSALKGPWQHPKKKKFKKKTRRNK